jgi:cytochrome bd-type quinol oxidase subunit 2
MGIKGAYERFRESRANLWFQRILRFIQFVSPVVSIGLFASRLVKIVQQDPTEGRGRLTASNGAVVGILAAAILYTLIAMLLSCFLEHKPKLIRWSLMFLDLCFVGAFIAVAVLTRPNGGSSGPCRQEDGTGLGPASQVVPRKANCKLPWGTFITAIIST